MSKKNKPDRGPYTEGDLVSKKPPNGPSTTIDYVPTVLVRLVNVDPVCASGCPKGTPVRLANASGVSSAFTLEGLRLGDVADVDVERVRLSGMTRGVVHETELQKALRCVVELQG